MASYKRNSYPFENALQRINNQYIRLSEEEVTFTRTIHESFLDELVPEMKEEDELFDEIYQELFHGGSFYDGLKVSNPDEYDLHMLMSLSKMGVETVFVHDPDNPGYVKIKLTNIRQLCREQDFDFYEKLLSCVNRNNYLNASLFRSWFESVVQKSLNNFPQTPNNEYKVDLPHLGPICVSYKIHGPAVNFKVNSCKSRRVYNPNYRPQHANPRKPRKSNKQDKKKRPTLKIRGNVCSRKLKMEIDLVPALRFNVAKLSGLPGIRQHPVFKKKPYFFVVAKTPKDGSPLLWRLSFQEQERLLISNKNYLKPAVKLLKYLRDKENHHVIASYFIKNLFLWELDKKPASFWDSSLSNVFMVMLNIYRNCLYNDEIAYYWNKNDNLLLNIGENTIENIAGRINRIYNDIADQKNDKSIERYFSR